MKFERIPPCEPLREYVQYFWTLVSDDASLVPRPLGPLADGCPGIVIQLSGTFYDDVSTMLPQAFVYGQTIKRTSLYVTGKFKWVGVCFYPHALKSVFGFNASELTDGCLDLNELKINATTAFTEHLFEVKEIGNQIDIISEFLLAHISRYKSQIEPITRYASKEIIKANGSISLKELQRQLNLSERTFERKFEQHVGISPKLFSRVCRFQRSLHQLKNNNYSLLSDIAFDGGYTDQSHFIRTFKEFAGCSPYEFQKQPYQAFSDFSVMIK
jgi:AraC-like DNA-binding protein